MKTHLLKFSLCLSILSVSSALSFGQNWTSIATPVTTNLILFDIFFPDGQNSVGFAGGSHVTWNGDGTVYKTMDQGASWSVVWSSTVNGTGVTALFFHDLDNGFAGTQSGELMKTVDGGVNWTSTDFDLNNDQGEVTDIEFFDLNNGVLSTLWNGMYRTTDGGNTWVPATTNPSTGQYALCYADMNTLFSCGNDQSIFKSTDGGDNWSNSYSGTFQLVNLGIDFYDANNGMATSEDGQYFKTTDGGANWIPATIPGQGGLMRGVIMLDLNNIFVCATPGQVFRTIDGGANWTDDSGVDPDPSYYSITFTGDGTGFVSGSGSTGGTILKRTSINVGIENLPKTDRALHVYPNPVSDILKVEFNTERGESFELSVINDLGQVILTKPLTSVNGELVRTELELWQFAEGSYIVELRANGSVLGSKRISVVGR